MNYTVFFASLKFEDSESFFLSLPLSISLCFFLSLSWLSLSMCWDVGVFQVLVVYLHVYKLLPGKHGSFDQATFPEMRLTTVAGNGVLKMG